MEELEKYNDAIINLYKQGFSMTHISDFLYGKVNSKLKAFNRLSHGELWVNIPKFSKANCIGHVYKVIYIEKMKKLNGGN